MAMAPLYLEIGSLTCFSANSPSCPAALGVAHGNKGAVRGQKTRECFLGSYDSVGEILGLHQSTKPQMSNLLAIGQSHDAKAPRNLARQLPCLAEQEGMEP